MNIISSHWHPHSLLPRDHANSLSTSTLQHVGFCGSPSPISHVSVAYRCQNCVSQLPSFSPNSQRSWQTYISYVVSIANVPAIVRLRRSRLGRHDGVVDVALDVEAVVGVKGHEGGVFVAGLEEREGEVGDGVDWTALVWVIQRRESWGWRTVKRQRLRNLEVAAYQRPGEVARLAEGFVEADVVDGGVLRPQVSSGHRPESNVG